MEARIESLTGPLPTLTWRWDLETDILSGSFTCADPGAGHNGSVELSDDEGSMVVLDVSGGVICGVDVVVWPEVHTLPELSPPAAGRDGRVVIPSRTSRPGIASLEVDTSLSLATNAEETVFHLRSGARRPVEVIRVADRLLVEVDQRRRLAGFWMVQVPPFPPHAA